ncbi:hypothetical protein WICPIJ_004551 [Wickerhamomyces pijperi]|uniref:YTH domain-containing protein n=1 Tax=Wickerhamomyces pijperi TaxID=599730 RepID=A0A9P8Q5Q1_WICPI|nr:hypothetical protein WICPIJ_004551 [Wickerhamomyces pijperi]
MVSNITPSTSVDLISQNSDINHSNIHSDDLGSEGEYQLDFSKMIDDIVLSDDKDVFPEDWIGGDQRIPRSLNSTLESFGSVESNFNWNSPLPSSPKSKSNNSCSNRSLLSSSSSSSNYVYHTPVSSSSVSTPISSFGGCSSVKDLTNYQSQNASLRQTRQYQNFVTSNSNSINPGTPHFSHPYQRYNRLHGSSHPSHSSNKSLFIGSLDYLNTFEDSPNLVLSPDGIYIPPGSKFFIIKSFNEQDVKSSFIHKVWTSTELGNKRLHKAYKMKKPSERIFMFFSVNGSGKFSGIAEMKSCVLKDIDMKYNDLWVENSKYSGYFQIQWIFIKDIKNCHLKHLKNSSNDFKPVTISRDTQEVPFGIGLEMIKSFKKTFSNTSFLQNL